MSALVATMLLAATVSLLLLGASARRLTGLPLLGEIVMLLAMLDTHLPQAGLLPPLLWSTTLAACALATALADRLRRRTSTAPRADRTLGGRSHRGRTRGELNPTDPTLADRGVADRRLGDRRLGDRMFGGRRLARLALAAAPADGAPHADRLHTVGMLLAAGLIAAGAAAGAAHGGGHAHGGIGLVPPLLAALLVYAVAALFGIRHAGPGRVEGLRRAASAVALLAMGGMALA